MIDFTYQSGNSFLHKLNPTAKIIGLLLFSLLLLLTKGISCLCIFIILTIFLMKISNLDFKTVFSPLKRIIWFLISIFFVNFMFYNNGTCLFQFGFICISKEGAIQGFNIVIHTLSITVLSSIFIRTTTSIEIMKAMQQLMHPLEYLGIPTRDIALIMSISLQFIPVFFSDLDRIRKAQISRGADFTGGTLLQKAKAVLPLVIPAFISAFRRADELSLAIDARGFRIDQTNKLD